MSLRIYGRGAQADPEPGNSWTARLAKLIPGEALALYGAGQTIVPDNQPAGLWILAAGCLVLIGILRWKGTQDGSLPPQIPAIIIAAISFLLWVVALQPPAGPLDLGDKAWVAALVSLLWATIVPLIYKGDEGKRIS